MTKFSGFEMKKPEFAEEKDLNAKDVREWYEVGIRSLQEGDVVEGEVVQIGPESIIVDIGYKSDGGVRAHEFMDEEGNLKVKVGDKIEVLVEKIENEDGMVVLSKEKVDEVKIWDKISESCEKGSFIEGKILFRVKGGFSVDIGMSAFLPGSQVDFYPVKNPERLIGKTFKFKVLKLNKRQRNVILSRRAYLEKERELQKEETLENIEEGQSIKGVVKNITDYGVFMDLGGIDGLLHIADMSWIRVKHPSELFSVGSEAEVKVLSVDRASERISLGLKQLTPNPWEGIEEKYPVDSRVKGKVISLTNYGIFVELAKGVEGLIHTSEIFWGKKIKHPSQIANVGDTIEAVVLVIDMAKKRISLGMKDIQPNLWELHEKKHPVGSIVEGKVKNITDFGIFIEIEEGIDGLVHISNISWTERIKHPSELYKKGQRVKTVVLNIDKENKKFSLGIKQLVEDPWQEVSQRYEEGQIVEGKVTSITDFGIFLEIEKGVEGLVHLSEIDEKKVKNLAEITQIGEVLSCKIISLDPKERRMSLSLKGMQK